MLNENPPKILMTFTIILNEFIIAFMKPTLSQ